MAKLIARSCFKRIVSGVLSNTVQNPAFNKNLYLHTSAFLNVIGQEIKMPSLSPTMTEGTIVKWLKKEGDTVAPGDVLCEIQTDKAVMSFETEEEGILAKIMLKDDSKDVKVGTVIGLLVSEGEDWQSVEVPSGSSASGNNVQDEKEVEEPLEGSVVGIQITMPSLSPTMSEGTIVKWYKKEGDPVAAGDVLCDIQTDKAVMAFETEEEGILAKILISDGLVKVGTLIALIAPEGEDWKNVTVPVKKKDTVSSSKDVDDGKSAAETTLKPEISTEPHNYGPAVRGLLELYQINSKQITPSGRNKKLLKSDVLQFIAENKLQAKPPKPVPLPGSKTGSRDLQEKSIKRTETVEKIERRRSRPKYVDIEISSMRKTIAKRLTESKMSIPHTYATVESGIDSVIALRKQLKSVGINASLNDFIVKAVALSLRHCPMVNCIYENDQAVLIPNVDISVAVATDNGLITPIIKSADGKSVDEISSEMKELAGRARKGKLQLHEFQGGSFTISNLGMFGISEFSAIINPPQCGILAIGSGRPVPDITGKPVTKMTAMLSYDARAVSESAAADFLETLQFLLENPAAILTSSNIKKQTRSAVAV